MISRRNEVQKKQSGKKTTSIKKAVPTNKPASVDLQHYIEEIRIRANEIYLQRGNMPGDDLSDWLQAEREIKQKHGLV
jgi:hypothetical protein